jgi:hypothetical protein
MNRRIQSIVASAYAGTIAQSDCRYMQSVAHNIEAVPADVVSFATHCLIIGLLFVGEHAAIHTLARRARTLGQPQALLARTEQWVFVSDRILDKLPIVHERCRVPQSSSVASHSQCAEEMVRAYTPPDRYSPEDYQRSIPVVAVLAQTVRQGGPLTTKEEGNSLSQLLALVKTLPQGSFVGADLVNSMALLGARMFDEEAWGQLMDQVLIRNRLLPPAAEWRRAGALALAAKWKGRPRTADSLVREAQRLATMLSEPKFGEGGSTAARGALERLVRVGPSIPSMRSSHDGPNLLPTANAVAMSRIVRDPFERAWAQQLADVGQVRRLYVVAADASEGMEFARRVAGRDAILVVHADSSASIPEGTRAICVVHDPGAGIRVHGELLARIERHVREGAYLIVVGPSGRPAPKAWSGDHRALFALAAGQVVELASVVGDRTAGCEVLRWLIWRRTRRLVEFDATAEALLASTNWSGGLAEMESVAASLEAMGSTRISAGVLARLGWSARASRRVGSVSIEVVDAIADCLCGGEALSSRDVHLRAGVPLRTVNRALSELLAVGRLVRTGRGRATRYCVRIEASETSDSSSGLRRVREAGGHGRSPEMGMRGPPRGASRHV